MSARVTAAVVAVVLGAWGLGAGRGRADDRKPAGEDVAAAERAAYDAAKPVFAAHCAACHTTGGARADAKAIALLDVASYPFGGKRAAEAGQAVRAALGVAGDTARMPKDHRGLVTGTERTRVLTWADAFDRAHAGAGAPPR